MATKTIHVTALGRLRAEVTEIHNAVAIFV